MTGKKKEDDVVVENTNEKLLADAEDLLDRAETCGEDGGWCLANVGPHAVASIAKSLLVIARVLAVNNTPMQTQVGCVKKSEKQKKRDLFFDGRSDGGP